MKYEISNIEDEGFSEGFWTGTKKLFIFIMCTIIIATLAIILVIYLSNQTTELKGAMRIENLMEHLNELQEIANKNGGTRTTGPGFNASADYISLKLREAGYEVSEQVFNLTLYKQINVPEFHFIEPFNTKYIVGKDFFVFSYSGNDNVTQKVHHVDNRGCDISDWTTFPQNFIALIRRGDCTFNQKLNNAILSNAAGKIGRAHV